MVIDVWGLVVLRYELLEGPVVLARKTAERAGLGGVRGGRVVFEQADLLTAPLQGAAMVLLTSQCWDRALLQAVKLKLEAELDTPGAMVRQAGRQPQTH